MRTITCRVTVKKYIGDKQVTLTRYNTYGIMPDETHIYTAEGRKFTAGRKTGFGKTGTWELEHDESGLANIYGLTNGYNKVYVDNIEEYWEE